MVDIARLFRDLGLRVLERGWLSSNNILFQGSGGRGLTVVDTSYASHAAQTLGLLGSHAGQRGVERVVNTHLHSDHCGGNASLQRFWGCDVWVPETLLDPVRRWDPKRLTFETTDQRCDRFDASRGIAVGEMLQLGDHAWQVVASDGHDPDSLMFFQPDSRVLISADALWEDRLAIIFPEIDGTGGFLAARHTLNTIEALAPSVVIPGHGRPFRTVATALSASRRRLDRFQADPAAHLRHAARALSMFNLLEVRARPRAELVGWLCTTPIFVKIIDRLGLDAADAAAFAEELVAGLLRDGLARLEQGNLVSVAGS